MKMTISVLFLFVVVASAGFSVKAQKAICTVDDPSGTRLNVRDDPGGGRIVAKLRNDAVVRIEFWAKDTVTALPWAKISVYRNRRYVPLGYVFGDYLNCN